MDVKKTIEQIYHHIIRGNELGSILINPDLDTWGESGAYRRVDIDQTIAAWEREGQDYEADISDLVVAGDWLWDHREDHLRFLASELAGIRYDSLAAHLVMDLTDWQDYYPEVDGDGLLTGELVDAQADGYLNVDDIALVSEDELSASQIRDGRETGYVRGL